MCVTRGVGWAVMLLEPIDAPRSMSSGATATVLLAQTLVQKPNAFRKSSQDFRIEFLEKPVDRDVENPRKQHCRLQRRHPAPLFVL